MTRRACAGPQDSDTPFPILPPEVIEIIIDFLEDKRSWQAAGLVQRSWYHRTRVHLFRDVNFGVNTERSLEAPLIQLGKLLEIRPTLARCIQHLTLPRVRSFESEIVHLIPITPLLTSLTSFALGNVDWSLLSDKTVASLYEVMSKPKMRQVSLHGAYNFDITPLSQFHNLRELDLRDVKPSSKSSATSLKPRTSLPISPAPDDRLHTLHINRCGEVLKTLIAYAGSADGTLDIFRPTTIRMGPLDLDSAMNEAWAVVLERCGAFVENYHLFHDADTFPPQGFPLRHFPKLKCFHMILISTYYSPDSDSPPTILLEELEHLSQSDTPRDLSELWLEFGFRDPDEPNDDEYDVQKFVNSDFWTKLGGILAKPAFAKLKDLVIAFDIIESLFSNTVWEEARTKIMSAMPNLSTRPGVVEVTTLLI